MILALAQALLHFLWQGCLVWGLTALLLRSIRKPNLRYAVACGALGGCLLLPVASILITLRSSPESTQANPAVSTQVAVGTSPQLAPEPGRPRTSDLSTSIHRAAPVILSVWGLGSALLALRLLLGLNWARRHQRASQPILEGPWLEMLRTLAARAGLRRRIRLHLGAGFGSPFTVGVWRPLILVPASLLTGMPGPLVEAILAHELAHIRRLDYLVNLVQSAVEILLFYHPAVWWISRRIRLERELACDDVAARLLGEPRRLALALHELDRFQLSIPAAVPAATGGHLMQRIRRLLHPEPRPHGVRILYATLAVGGLCIALGLAARKSHAAVVPQTSPKATETRDDSLAFSYGHITMDAPPLAYCLIRKDRPMHLYRGTFESLEEIRSLQAQKSDALWFRENQVSYVIRDPALLQEADRAFRQSDALGDYIQQLRAQRRSASDQKQIQEQMLQEQKKAKELQEVAKRAQHEAQAEQKRLQEEAMQVRQETGRAKSNAELARKQAEQACLDAARLKSEAEAAHKQLEAQRSQLEAERHALSSRLEPLEAEREKAMAEAEARLAELVRKAKTKGLAIPQTRQ